MSSTLRDIIIATSLILGIIVWKAYTPVISALKGEVIHKECSHRCLYNTKTGKYILHTERVK